MNYNNIIFYDFETGSANPYRCQPTQIAAVVIDGRKLKLINGGEFNSYINVMFDKDACDEYNLDMIEDEALGITGISKETLKSAPDIKAVWNQFVNFVNNYNYKKNKWSAPIRAGHNNTRFDDIIVNRICRGHNKILTDFVDSLEKNDILEKGKISIKEPYGFGPWDEENNETTLFHPRDNIDIMKTFLWPWTENMQDIKSISMDSARGWLGIEKEGSHNALKDVKDGADLLIRFLSLTRKMATKVRWTK